MMFDPVNINTFLGTRSEEFLVYLQQAGLENILN
jgi:hypothetical protein